MKFSLPRVAHAVWGKPVSLLRPRGPFILIVTCKSMSLCQSFSKCGFWQLTVTHSKCMFSGPTPIYQMLRVGPAVCAFTNPLGDSHGPSSLRTSLVHEFSLRLSGW